MKFDLKNQWDVWSYIEWKRHWCSNGELCDRYAYTHFASSRIERTKTDNWMNESNNESNVFGCEWWFSNYKCGQIMIETVGGLKIISFFMGDLCCWLKSYIFWTSNIVTLRHVIRKINKNVFKMNISYDVWRHLSSIHCARFIRMLNRSIMAYLIMNLCRVSGLMPFLGFEVYCAKKKYATGEKSSNNIWADDCKRIRRIFEHKPVVRRPTNIIKNILPVRFLCFLLLLCSCSVRLSLCILARDKLYQVN